MIGFIQGKIKDIIGEQAIVMTGSGVGYAVFVGSKGMLVDQEVSLYIHTAVRENDISLYGFENVTELKIFHRLLDVSGVGFKTAYTLLQAVGTAGVIRAVQVQDPSGLKAPGVGQKTAERVVLELRDKLDDNLAAGLASSGKIEILDNSMVSEAIAALEGLGYKHVEVQTALKGLDVASYQTSQDLVKALLVRV